MAQVTPRVNLKAAIEALAYKRGLIRIDQIEHNLYDGSYTMRGRNTHNGKLQKLKLTEHEIEDYNGWGGRSQTVADIEMQQYREKLAWDSARKYEKTLNARGQNVAMAYTDDYGTDSTTTQFYTTGSGTSNYVTKEKYVKTKPKNFRAELQQELNGFLRGALA
jgi:hypothetical protein